jgi:hypothetical protein
MAFGGTLGGQVLCFDVLELDTLSNLSFDPNTKIKDPTLMLTDKYMATLSDFQNFFYNLNAR